LAGNVAAMADKPHIGHLAASRQSSLKRSERGYRCYIAYVALHCGSTFS
jgi:hypothetical protein